MADKTWKATERRIANLLGGKRVPVSGRQRGDAPDIEHSWLSLEIKHRKTLPEWFKDAMDQAVKSQTPVTSHEVCGGVLEGKGPDKLPIVILHEHRGDDYCVIRLKDFKEWFV